MFKSVVEMCRFWGIVDTHVYYARLRIGWTKAKALSTPVVTRCKNCGWNDGTDPSSEK